MARGRVRVYNENRGYGFITNFENGGDVFVRFSAIQTDGMKILEEGQEVEFEIVETDAGLQAANVRVK